MSICGSEELMAFLFGLEGASDLAHQLAHLKDEHCGRCGWVLGEVRQAVGEVTDVDSLVRRVRELGVVLPEEPPVGVDAVKSRVDEVQAARVSCRVVGGFLAGGRSATEFKDFDFLPHLERCQKCSGLLAGLVDRGESFLELVEQLRRVKQFAQFDVEAFGKIIERARGLSQLWVLKDARDALREHRREMPAARTGAES